jgi:hypothetical protein
MSRGSIVRFVAAVLVVEALAGGIPGVVGAGGLVHQSLVGTWGKEIPASIWAREHAAAEIAGHYAIRIGPDGVASVYVGTDPIRGKTYAQRLADTTMPIAVSGAIVTFGPMVDQACGQEATYRWAVSGQTLDFTLVRDACGYRFVLMTAGRFTRER